MIWVFRVPSPPVVKSKIINDYVWFGVSPTHSQNKIYSNTHVVVHSFAQNAQFFTLIFHLAVRVRFSCSRTPFCFSVSAPNERREKKNATSKIELTGEILKIKRTNHFGWYALHVTYCRSHRRTLGDGHFTAKNKENVCVRVLDLDLGSVTFLLIFLLDWIFFRFFFSLFFEQSPVQLCKCKLMHLVFGHLSRAQCECPTIWWLCRLLCHDFVAAANFSYSIHFILLRRLWAVWKCEFVSFDCGWAI